MVTNSRLNTITTIVRFHDPLRLYELNRCLFSLLCQDVDCLSIIIATQSFTDQQLDNLALWVNGLRAINESVEIKIVNMSLPKGFDGRTKLLNSALKYCETKYVAFLDYDDTIYPEAYSMLVDKAIDTESGLVFASVRMVYTDVLPYYNQAVSAKSNLFKGNNLLDLFSANFCPIHSYIIDRHMVGGDLYFDDLLTWEEDYDLLLRLASKYKSDFSLVGTEIGDYYQRNDGSNSIGAAGVEGRLTSEAMEKYKYVAALIEARRRMTYVNSNIIAAVKPNVDFNSKISIRSLLNS